MILPAKLAKRQPPLWFAKNVNLGISLLVLYAFHWIPVLSMMKKVHFAPSVQLESFSIWNMMEMELICVLLVQLQIAMIVTLQIHAKVANPDLFGWEKSFLQLQLLNALPARTFIVHLVQMELLNVISAILIAIFFLLLARLQQAVFNVLLKFHPAQLVQMTKLA